jgi:hypothetical protein
MIELSFLFYIFCRTGGSWEINGDIQMWLAQGICEGLWIHRVLKELKITVELPLKLYCDNKAAISIAYNPV